MAAVCSAEWRTGLRYCNARGLLALHRPEIATSHTRSQTASCWSAMSAGRTASADLEDPDIDAQTCFPGSARQWTNSAKHESTKVRGWIPIVQSRRNRRQPRGSLARPGQAAASPRTACSDLRLVHGGVRHARSERGEGAVGGVGVVAARKQTKTVCCGDILKKSGTGRVLGHKR
jgi:hypothetical protein